MSDVPADQKQFLRSNVKDLYHSVTYRLGYMIASAAIQLSEGAKPGSLKDWW